MYGDKGGKTPVLPQHTVRSGMSKNPLQQGHFRWTAGVLVVEA